MQYDAFILAMKFNDAAPPKRQFCVVAFYHRFVDLQLFVLIVFAHGRSTLMKRRGERSGRSARMEGFCRREVHIAREVHTNGGLSLHQGVSTIPRYTPDTGQDRAGLREEQERIASP
jgi:hypothetical protein